MPKAQPRLLDPKEEINRPFYFARKYDEKKISKLATESAAAPHNYFGYIFSKESSRPANYFKDYFLPICPQPPPLQHVSIVNYAPLPTDRIMSLRGSQRGVLPLSTVKIQWGIKKGATVYNCEHLYRYFSRFGEVTAIYSWTTNSCLVVFAYLTDAKTVVVHPNLGVPWGPLVASWLDPRLNNASFYRKNLDIFEDAYNIVDGHD